ncbi:Pup--protein ligase [Streptomyces avidinii]
MTVRRVMGIETEYGISVPGHPNANAMLTSSQIVNAYAAAMHRARRARWDFEEENPLRDARGFDLAREAADNSQLTDEDIGLANVILTNGARLYVDHAHPEYSSPEITNPLDAVLWDKAGERIMAEAAVRAAQLPGAQPIHLYKNNTDNKGASYGTHENYLMKRETPFRGDRAPPDPLLRLATGRDRRGTRGHRPGRPRTRLPDQPARGLLRGRGRPGDHPEAAHHQHPGRAALGRREVPPATRDHRRREPRRSPPISSSARPHSSCP